MEEVTVQLVEVEFDQAVNADLFAQLKGLTQTKNVKDNLWELTFQTEEDPRARIFDFATANGLRALQIVAKAKNLEQIFREKTAKKN